MKIVLKVSGTVDVFSEYSFHTSEQKLMLYKEVCLVKVDTKNSASNSWLGVPSIRALADHVIISSALRCVADGLLEPPGGAVARTRGGSSKRILPLRPGTALSQAPLRVNRHGRRGRSAGRCAQHGQPPAAAAW